MEQYPSPPSTSRLEAGAGNEPSQPTLTKEPRFELQPVGLHPRADIANGRTQ